MYSMSNPMEKGALQCRLANGSGLSNQIISTQDGKYAVEEILHDLCEEVANVYVETKITEWKENLGYLLARRGSVQSHPDVVKTFVAAEMPVAQGFIDRVTPDSTQTLHEIIETDIIRLESLLKGPLEKIALIREEMHKLRHISHINNVYHQKSLHRSLSDALARNMCTSHPT